MLKPDIVLLIGDIIDEDIKPVIRQNLGETLRKIESKYGVFGVNGNHEYIGGVDEACKYLEQHGITMLRDSAIVIANSFVLIGREDISGNRFMGKPRKPLDKIISKIDTSMPNILLDHQPLSLNDAVVNNIDLILCGHTHHGQLWPFNLITKAVYEVSCGYKLKNNTNIYVSCGVGTWGPPIRTSCRPELLNLRLKFN